ncbi:putative glutamate ABC transporter, permease [Thermobispora bispora]|uniref:Polar amino acid ABC transporter, inner membrane subunit n=1 Tax=Thermobispora bispora (strain ATCC 19993 / DSM 43833 / CBS 139.67 / JCM 10125 / KCTC 9307 / NBRC 14880 / R51) TaxID=469371 RepID=D6Y826_THEBD|nr:amino acid ABC transporter permease [Thermobispora bispora]ADG87845.1 polar amino acid ABC transporter, inner membrane subunit [Thermobispora bispora DSM 43833]MBO2473730.1 amino acid ABC transporter permease [Actinomycetales bacterium]MBX6167243.1 amino acid ABC transporter permease [Thermobispora bispora]MDI9582240.1 amino acid ABC transporter permease [Thermobispora sp.]
MEAVVEELPVILQAFGLTVRLAALSALISLVWGTVLATMRVSPLPVLRWAGALYVNVLRNTPLTLVIVFCGLGLGTVMDVRFSADDLSVNSFWLSTLGLSAYTAAFVCEVIRSGINTVPLGQAEAARSLGLTFPQTLRLVILPQAMRAVVAPLGTLLNALIKNTTVAAAIGVAEAALRMKNLFDAHGDAVIPLFLGFAAGFVILTLPLNLAFGWLAGRLAVVR